MSTTVDTFKKTSLFGDGFVKGLVTLTLKLPTYN